MTKYSKLLFTFILTFFMAIGTVNASDDFDKDKELSHTVTLRPSVLGTIRIGALLGHIHDDRFGPPELPEWVFNIWENIKYTVSNMTYKLFFSTLDEMAENGDGRL